MSAGVIALIVVVAVLAGAALAYAALRPRLRTARLRRRFGPEYDRVVGERDGDAKAAEAELDRRLRAHRDLDLKPLTPQARERYVARWTGLQEAFVDGPPRAVAAAEGLIAELMRDRGYPADRYDEAMAVLSVDHAPALHGYRQAHATVRKAHEGQASTEELRTAMVRARGLFAELIDEPGRDGSGPTPTHRDEPRHHARGDQRHGRRGDETGGRLDKPEPRRADEHVSHYARPSGPGRRLHTLAARVRHHGRSGS
jgi:hypothetical protein